MILKLSPNCSQAEAQMNQLEGEILEDIHRLASQKLTAMTQSRLLVAINQLFALLPIRFTMKEADGYLHEVVDEFPEWKEKVSTLWIEQALLYEDLREIRDHLQEVEDYAAAQSWLTGRLKDWSDRLRRHEEQEHMLTEATLHKSDC